MSIEETALWQDATHLPPVLADVVRRAADGGLSDLATLLAGRRIVAVGNGAAHYAGLAMQAAAWSVPSAVEVVAVPAGVVLTGGFSWRPNDVPLVISTSGKLRDVIDAIRRGAFPEQYGIITSSPDSPLARTATAAIHLDLPPQHSDTHTCGYLANLLTAQLLYRELAGQELAVLDAAPERVAAALAGAPDWARNAARGLRPKAATAFATGAGVPAALETALLLKEVAGIYTEGMDAREAATTGMYALDDGFLTLAHAAPGDPVAAETLEICAGRGATVLEVPGVIAGEEVIAPITTFPAALALALELARARGRDPDHPPWAATYYRTAHA
jgi:glucosamine--fructose-6-phosphate aminotransferase (isomerizing)